MLFSFLVLILSVLSVSALPNDISLYNSFYKTYSNQCHLNTIITVDQCKCGFNVLKEQTICTKGQMCVIYALKRNLCFLPVFDITKSYNFYKLNMSDYTESGEERIIR